MSLSSAFDWTRPPLGLTVESQGGPIPGRSSASAADDGAPSSSALAGPSSQPLEASVTALSDGDQSAVTGSQFYVDIGSTSPIKPRSPRNPTNQTELDEAARTSIHTVLAPKFISNDPRRAARILVALLKDGESGAPNTFRTRPMSLNDRKDIIADIRDAESRSFWGAILDQTDGRRMLATWLRESVTYAEWESTRLSILRLLADMPVLYDHLSDEETNFCLGKAVAAVKKCGKAKSVELAASIRERWESKLQKGPAADEVEDSKSSSSGPASRLAVEAPAPSKGNAPVKKGKAVAGSSAGLATAPSGPPAAQSMSNISRTSAMLSSIDALKGSSASKAKPAAGPLASTSRLALATGPQRNADVQNLAKKTVTRVDSDMKQVCSKCNTPFVPGVTSTTRVRPSAAHARTVDQVCLKCTEKAKKTPAPPRSKLLPGKRGREGSESATPPPQAVAKPPPAKRAAGAEDMFSSLINKTEAPKTKKPDKMEGIEGAAASDEPAKKKRKNKSVSWREEDQLRQVRIIVRYPGEEEMDSQAGEADLHGLEHDEGQALKAHLVGGEDMLEVEEDYLEWYPAPLVECSDRCDKEPGCESDEGKKQDERCSRTLSAIYSEESEVPDSAGEPFDAEPINPRHVPEPIGQPEEWVNEGEGLVPYVGPSTANGDVSELLRKLAADGIVSGLSSTAAASAVSDKTSLESLGISSSGLQELLRARGGGGGSGVGAQHPGPPPTMPAYYGGASSVGGPFGVEQQRYGQYGSTVPPNSGSNPYGGSGSGGHLPQPLGYREGSHENAYHHNYNNNNNNRGNYGSRGGRGGGGRRGGNGG